jgi:hypothetical protein
MLARQSLLGTSPFYSIARASLCATHFVKLRNTHILSPLPYYINTYRALADVTQRFTYLTLFLFAREAPGLRNVTFNGVKCVWKHGYGKFKLLI